MCNRYTLIADLEQLQTRFALDSGPVNFRPQPDIRHNQGILAITSQHGDHTPRVMRWGLVPHWTTDPSKALYNARSETLHQKTSFADPFRKRRCLIPATGFFERGPSRGPSHLFTLQDNLPFAFAGVWQPWKTPDGRTIATCAIVTTPPNGTVRQVHDRMPAILLPDQETLWLDPASQDPDALAPLLAPLPDGLLMSTSG